MTRFERKEKQPATEYHNSVLAHLTCLYGRCCNMYSDAIYSSLKLILFNWGVKWRNICVGSRATVIQPTEMRP